MTYPTYEEWPFKGPTSDQLLSWKNPENVKKDFELRDFVIKKEEEKENDCINTSEKYIYSEGIEILGCLVLYRTMNTQNWKNEQLKRCMALPGTSFLLKTDRVKHISNDVFVHFILERVNNPDRWKKIIVFHYVYEPTPYTWTYEELPYILSTHNWSLSFNKSENAFEISDISSLEMVEKILD